VPRGDRLSVHVFGIRHHGPGSARSLLRALETLEPDAVLVEGPPDADAVIPFAAHEAMRPPVALLVYTPGATRDASFYPFATYSPEWQALRFALRRSLPVRFMDLPRANVAPRDTGERTAGHSEDPADRTRRDPLAAIAAAAGFSDGERWWDRMVESRRNETDAFEALAELMVDVRASIPQTLDPNEALREAAMRQIVRAAQREFERVAVVCGAWHVPALIAMPPAKADAELLKGLPRSKTTATWVPWTFGRLTMASGYGAGVESPGWYEHLWESGADPIPSWMTKAARTLRDAQIDISPAHAIEATRLCGMLAAMRGAPAPGLHEAADAIRSIFCFGDALPMALLQTHLIVGERLGAVPSDVPQVPLATDLANEQRRLRMPPGADARELDLDLRKPGDLERSHVLHRLNILEIPWGKPRSAGSGRGTFHERWHLQWHPEFAVDLIEAAAYGTTVREAAAAKVLAGTRMATHLSEVTALLESTFAASLDDVALPVLARIDELAALTHDVLRILDALPSLAQVRRYGDVRGTDAGHVGATIDALVARACVGLRSAVLALDDDAATAVFDRLVATDAAIRMLDVPRHRELWLEALASVAADERVHGLVAGRALRLLFDADAIDVAAVERGLSRALSRSVAAPVGAATIEGLLRGSGLVLVHHPALLETIDRYVVGLNAETFLETLPLLRRTFATFAAPERRAMGERIARGANVGSPPNTDDGDIDMERARLVIPVLHAILGERVST